MEMLGVKSPPMSEANRLLAMALTLHDRDKCPGGCGHYLDETTQTDGWFEAHDDLVCDACAARERLRGEQEKPEPGSMTYVVDTRKSAATHQYVDRTERDAESGGE